MSHSTRDVEGPQLPVHPAEVAQDSREPVAVVVAPRLGHRVVEIVERFRHATEVHPGEADEHAPGERVESVARLGGRGRRLGARRLGGLVFRLPVVDEAAVLEAELQGDAQAPVARARDHVVEDRRGLEEAPLGHERLADPRAGLLDVGVRARRHLEQLAGARRHVLRALSEEERVAQAGEGGALGRARTGAPRDREHGLEVGRRAVEAGLGEAHGGPAPVQRQGRGRPALDGQLLEGAERPVVVLLRLRVGEEPRGGVSGVAAEENGALRVVGLLAVPRDLAGDPRGVGAPVASQAVRDLAVKEEPARRHEILAEDRRVEAVGEAVAGRHGAVGQRLLAGLDDQPPDARESPQVLLDLPVGPGHEVRDDGAQELAPGDACHLQDLALARVEAVELAPDEVAQAGRRREVDRVERPAEREDLAVADDVAALHEDVDEAAHEQREPLGARVNGGGECSREPVARETRVQVLRHLARAERPELELAGRASRPQVERGAAQAAGSPRPRRPAGT